MRRAAHTFGVSSLCKYFFYLACSLVIENQGFFGSQAPHESRGTLQNGDHEGQPRGRHYTAYGLSPVNKRDTEAYRKRWVLHVDVDEDDTVTKADFEKSTKNGRRYDYADSDMHLLSVSDALQVLKSLTPFYQGPFSI